MVSTVSLSSPNGSHLARVGLLPRRPPLTFLVFLSLQLDRILTKPHPHATGPKRPDSNTVESGKVPS